MKDTIVQKAEQQVKAIFSANQTEEMAFHNIEHTHHVVEAARKIAHQEHLAANDINIVTVAAWFHDVGYFFDRSHHEQASEKQAAAFLKEIGIPGKEIEEVQGCIKATHRDHLPDNIRQKVLKDADMIHLAEPDFLEKSLALREEWKAFDYEKYSKEQYLFDSLAFMFKHQYYTNYGQKVLQPAKEKNISELQQKIKEHVSEKSSKDYQKMQKKLNKAQDTSRGIETMFRATARIQINLSSIADNKSNILISVNAIVLSVMITYIVRDINAIDNLMLPVVAMVITNLLTIIFAVIATLPNVTPGKFTKEDVDEGKTNLMFFGNFHDMDVDTYEKSVWQLMHDYEYLYGTLIRDQYELGVVLEKKFSKLRIAYFIFLGGLIITFLLFVLLSL